MKYGARNRITARVKTVQSDNVMSLVKFEVKGPLELSSVVTTESVREMALKEGDQVLLLLKAVHVLPVKE